MAVSKGRNQQVWKKLFSFRMWKRIYIERLGEPLVYNVASIFIFLFGSFVKKIDYDLIPRQPYAFGLNEAFRRAAAEKVEKILVLEFGVAAGAGLFNLAHIACRLSKKYGVDYEVIGFDTGKGMPTPLDYRDHPEKYRMGDFPSLGLSEAALPSKTKIYFGEISQTLSHIQSDLVSGSRIAFVSVDVDFYSSTVECLKVFCMDPASYTASTVVYLDDVNNIDHNEFCGELLAINEFNTENEQRKITQMTQLRNWRIFKNAFWLDQMYFLHVLDSDFRNPANWKNEKMILLNNPYL